MVSQQGGPFNRGSTVQNADMFVVVIVVAALCEGVGSQPGAEHKTMQLQTNNHRDRSRFQNARTTSSSKESRATPQGG